MYETYPRRHWRRRVNRAELGQLRRDVIADSLMTDQLADQLERRVIALEEITAARWPRRIVVRWRLARDLRASVAGYGWVGGDFASRRIQAVSDGWIQPPPGTARPLRARRDHRG